jgi:hypothetical protein
MEILKSYLKVALPIAAILVINEELFSDKAYLNGLLKEAVLGIGENAEVYLQVRGGTKQLNGQQYYDTLELPVYKQKTLPLKEFMVKHVTNYQAGIFLGLIDHWPLEDWNVNTATGQAKLSALFPGLLETLDVN